MLGHGNRLRGLDDKSFQERRGERQAALAPLTRSSEEERLVMMDGMMGMGAGMLIWGVVGILLIVLLVLLITKLLKS